MTRFNEALCALVLCSLAAPAAAQHMNTHDARALREDPRLAPGQIAPVLEGLGDHHMKVTTRSERAQLFFDQGVKLTYGFNHQEALRAFKEAARLDPDCAMAYWGWALVLGPNLNLPMSADVVPQAWEAVQTAMKKRSQATPREKALIEALAKRFSADPEADRDPLNRAYFEAMRAAHRAFPRDNDIATLYAASIMNLSPWSYWTPDGKPLEYTEELLAVLEGVMERDPHHEGALHYYIHAVESVDPERGVAAADLLQPLAPGAGHLMHMPAHIYMRVGRYDESIEGNVLAAKADEGYIAQCRAQGMYPVTYYPHNVHFIAWAAIMDGRGSEALAASRKLASRVPMDDPERNFWGLYQTFLSMPLYTMVRFGMWELVLIEPKPPEDALYWTGIWHYARGMAHVRTGDVAKARKELKLLKAIGDDPASQEVGVGFSNATFLLALARETLSGEIEAARGRHDQAITHLDRAVRLEDSMSYTEPPDWYYPLRHTLGALLLEAGRAREAEVVYREDLKHYPDNGYSLFGLAQALRAQGKEAAAVGVEMRFEEAWDDADVVLKASRF